jgi:predicted permease
MLTMLGRDLRYAMRVLRGNPGFTAAAVFTLALGIGANTALFSVFDALLLKQLPVADPDSLVLLVYRNPGGERNLEFSYPIFSELRERNRTLTALIAATSGEDRMQVRIPPATDAEVVKVALVSDNFFDTLGVRPAIGSLLLDDDQPRAVLSHRFWTARFAEAATVLGQTVVVHGVPFTIAGVAPPGFFGHVVGEAPDMWVPASRQPQLWSGLNYLQASNVDWLMLMGRTRAGVTLPQAQADLASAMHAIEEAWKGTPKAGGLPHALTFEVTRGERGVSRLRDRFDKPLRVLMLIVGLVLLVACVNVASLLTARHASRESEIAIRQAIGAQTRHLATQFVAETLLLALAGGAAGVLLGLWGTDSLLPLLGDRNGILPLDVRADRRLLGFASLISVATGVLFGMLPVWRYARRPNVPLIASRGGRPPLTFGRALVIVQVALSVVLAVGALLFVRSLQKLHDLDAGFARQRVLFVRIDPFASGYNGPELASVNRRLRAAIAAIPGVQAVSQSGVGLMSGRSRTCCFTVPGYTPAAGERMAIRTNDVTRDYFVTMGMRLLHGRTFTDGDAGAKPRPVIVNEAFIRKYFSGAPAVGRSFSVGALSLPIVGVVADARYDGLREPSLPLIFSPARDDGPLQSIEVRAAASSRAIGDVVRRTVTTVDARLPLREIYTVEQLLDSAMAQERLMARLSGFFGVLVLGLACVGLYGLLAQLVARRTREIGIRMALGAERWQIMSLVLRETGLLVVSGLVLGLMAAFATTRLAAALLFDVSPTDPVSMILAPLCLTLAALAAAWFPARRAATLTPLTALRQE